MRFTRVGASALLAVVLAGCTTGGGGGDQEPSASPDALPSPSSTPVAAQVATIQIGVTGVSFVAEDRAVLETHVYAEAPTAAIDAITSVLDIEPTVENQETDNVCLPALTRVIWAGSLSVTYGADMFMPEGQQFVVGALAEGYSGISFESPDGLSVDDLAPPEWLAIAIPIGVIEGQSYIDIPYEIGGGTPGEHEDTRWGASARVIDGVVTSLYAPVYYSDNC